VTRQQRDNKPSFMQVVRLTDQSSLAGRELPRPTRSTLTLPNTTDTDLGQRASVQTTTGRRRALITGRAILAPVGTTIPTCVLTRGSRPRTRLVPAMSPSLVAATAGATLGTSRGILIPSRVGSRGPLRTITGARPTGAPSPGLLQPPKVVLLSLLVDVQQAPLMVLPAGTGRPLQDRLPSTRVPHWVRLRPGEPVVCQAPMKVDQADQEHTGGEPSRRPTEAPDKTLQPGLTLRLQCRRGIRQG